MKRIENTITSYSAKEFHIFCAFWVIVAFLEFIQDYLSAQWSGNLFYVSESLFYKFFWILFIPLALLTYSLVNKTLDTYSPPTKTAHSLISYFILTSLPIIIGLLHLLLFALFLSGMAKWINDAHWPLSRLIQEKLSTRLYIAISIYSVFLYLAYRASYRRKEKSKRGYSEVLPVKNGSKSVMVSTDSIKWIKSDGAYVELHTTDRKHVIVNSLKNLAIQLNPDQFKRIHKSTIVNLNLIAELNSRLNGDYDVILNEGTTLRLSRNYAKSLKGILL